MYFDEFNRGDRFTTRARPVTGTDIDFFAALTGATNPIFLDDEFGREMGYQGRITPGLLILSLALGLQYSMGLLDHMRAFLGIDELRFLTPVKPKDAIRCQIEVIDKKEGEKNDGIITFNWTCENQDGKSVLQAKAAFIAFRKPG